MTSLIHYPVNNQRTHYDIPSSVTSILHGAFFNSEHLSSVIIPDNVTTIESEAFSLCSNLTTINIPSKVKTIEEKTFYKCSALETVNFSYGVTNIDSDAFKYCSSLSSVVIPDSVEVIGGSAFSNCQSLKSVVLSSSLIKIYRQAFEKCGNLTSLSIPASVTYIGSDAFSSCSKLETVNYFGDSDPCKPGDSAFKNCGALDNNNVRLNYANTTFCGINDVPTQKKFCQISTNGIVNNNWYISEGMTISNGIVEGNASLLTQLLQEYHGVYNDGENKVEFKETTVIKKDITVYLSCNITIEGIDNHSWLVVSGHPLNESNVISGDVVLLHQYLSSSRAIDRLTGIEYNSETNVMQDFELTLCNNVTMIGKEKSTWLLKYGTLLNSTNVVSGDKNLLGMVLVEKYHFYDSKTSNEYDIETNVITRDIELRLCYLVKFNNAIANNSWLIIEGTSINDGSIISGDVGLLNYIVTHYVLMAMNESDHEMMEFGETTVVNNDIELVLLCCVTIDGFEEAWYVECGKPFVEGIVKGNETLLNEIFKTSQVIDVNTSAEYSETSIVEESVKLKLNHSVSCSGMLRGTWPVAHGTRIVDVDPELSEFINSNEYVVGNKVNNRIVKKTDIVNAHMKLIAMEKNEVSINFTDIEDDDNISASDIASNISTVSNLDRESIIVEIYRKNNQLSVIVYVSDSVTAHDVADAIAKCK